MIQSDSRRLFDARHVAMEKAWSLCLVQSRGTLQIQDRSGKHVLRFCGTGPIQCNITFSQAQKHG